jgi:hypothetical protein
LKSFEENKHWKTSGRGKILQIKVNKECELSKGVVA